MQDCLITQDINCQKSDNTIWLNSVQKLNSLSKLNSVHGTIVLLAVVLHKKINRSTQTGMSIYKYSPTY